jgi:hypothetical protein
MKLCYSLALFFCQLLTVTAAFATATVKFAIPVVYSSGGSGTNFVVAADLNGDSFPDMIVANTDGVAVRLNNGDGTFAAPVTYGTGGTSAFAVAVGDVNGDTIPDIVVTNMCSNSPGCSSGGVGVLIGIGDGTFQPAVSYNAGGPQTHGVVIGDVNNDGWPDIIVTSNCQPKTCVDGSIRLLLNNQDGTFTLTPTAIAPSMGGPLAIGDLNGDGNLDLVADIGVLLGNGDGTFTQDTSVTLPGGTISIALADVNNDGFLDVIVADQVSVKVQVGDGAGNLGLPVAYKSGGKRVLSVAVADFNGDSKPDIAVVNECSSLINNVCSSTGSLGVLAGNGDGTFQPFVSFVSGGNLATSVAVADANQDTKPDIFVSNVCESTTVCTNGTVAVFMNIFKAATSINVSSTNTNQLFPNQPVTLTATMVSQVPVADGNTVTFFNGTTLIGTGTTTSGVATLNFPGFLHAGAKSIKATYSGDIYHNAGSGTFTQTVKRFATTTTVTSGENPTDLGVKTTFTASVVSSGGNVPTGSVQFMNGGKLVATVALNNLGTAKFTIAFSVSGGHIITVNYLGDTDSAPSTSDPLQETVQ